MRCWERRVGRIRASCRHEGSSAGRGGGHGVGGVVRRGEFCGPVAVSHECAISAALRAIDERCVRCVGRLPRSKTSPQSPRTSRRIRQVLRRCYREGILAFWRLFDRYDREVVYVLAIINGSRGIQDIRRRRLPRSESRGGALGPHEPAGDGLRPGYLRSAFPFVEKQRLTPVDLTRARLHPAMLNAT